MDNHTLAVATDNRDGRKIRATSRPTCVLCGKAGAFIHKDLTDRLFGSWGSWNLKKCSNQNCGLVWLDPMPLPQDIEKAYANYYTHATRNGTSRSGILKRAFRQAKENYWDRAYGYHQESCSAFTSTLGTLLRFSPIHRREADADVRFLPANPGGRLLDVGCGSGDWLLDMQRRGWRVEGLDFDENAVAVARNRGLDVAVGSLEEQSFQHNRFDAITLSHVIEHVPDPVQTLTECAKILKPGGRLVLFTPNADSLSHRFFKESWRGLEPPRHLHLFSLQSMRRALEEAGFKSISMLPFIVTSVIYESILLRWGRTDIMKAPARSRRARIQTMAFKLIELCILGWNPSAGDCVIAVATKR